MIRLFHKHIWVSLDEVTTTYKLFWFAPFTVARSIHQVCVKCYSEEVRAFDERSEWVKVEVPQAIIHNPIHRV